MEFNEELDYNADIFAYKRSRERIRRSDMEASRKAALIANCDYAIMWLETGRRPGNKRGVERLAAYQREVSFETMERYAKPLESLRIQTTEEERLERLHMEYILSLLTERERECFELNNGHMYTEREIAQMLGIQRTSVQQFLMRAKNKIKKYKSQPMPLKLLLDDVV